jgi:hypothetical protein
LNEIISITKLEQERRVKVTVINKYPSATSEKDLKALAYQAYILLSAMNLKGKAQDAILYNNANEESFVLKEEA